MESFFQRLLTILQTDSRFTSTDGAFLRNAVIQAAMNLDANLLQILLDDDEIQNIFFADVNGVKVFDKIKFAWVINNRQLLPDSYTRFKNKIGLVDADNNFISSSGDVELVFPYKDCVLEGGQTSDDQRRNEIFYNETLAPNEIDRLLAPKVFTNAKRYTAAGVVTAANFSDDDNLIIKGNNLLAIASLLTRFENRVKCIYIDVPYNTGNDSFGYNDRFNHSTWLTFIKNRLNIAKRLLSDNGSIWISIDDDEQAYLKVLCDEIFGRDNFVTTIIWEKMYTVKNDSAIISNSHEYILVYAKNIGNLKFNLLPRTEEMDSRYSNPDNDPRGNWKPIPLYGKGERKNGRYPVVNPNNGKEYFPAPNSHWLYRKEDTDKLLADNRIYFGKDGNSQPNIKRFLFEVQQGTKAKSLWKFDEVGHNHEAKNEAKAVNSESIFATPKPERLIQRILTLATNEGDLVLDSFLGSGTTAAVAHKMNRRYIGVEQMDYIDTVAVARLKKVIDGEQGGISRAVGWSGGGSFVYCELAKLNQKFVDEIETAASFDEIQNIYRRVVKSGFISCKVNPAEIDAAAEDFRALTLDNQKRFLLELLDKNLLYVNYCDIDDAEFAVSDEDKKFTRNFYEGDDVE